jgi:corrinoid protein of di/trimethylamine methyltransferase
VGIDELTGFRTLFIETVRIVIRRSATSQRRPLGRGGIIMADSKEILVGLKQGVVDYDIGRTKHFAQLALDQGLDPKIAISEGLSAGMSVVGEKYEMQEMFLPEVMAASETMYAALDLLLPHLKAEGGKAIAKKIVIGTVEGDVHSIGKTIVGTLLKVYGYDVKDLGADVPLASFIETAEAWSADMIAMSTLMTTTMAGMEDVMRMLQEKGLRSKYKVAVGGAPVNEDFRQYLKADMTADNADKAVKEANRLFGGE